MKTKSNDVNNRDPRIVTMYRVAIGIGFFALFLSFTTIYVMNRVEKARYHVGLKQALSILSQALVYANFESDDEKISEVYYLYLVDALTSQFASTNCAHSDTLACKPAEYRTLNNKSVMSDLIFKSGVKLSINNILFMINKPRFKDDALLVTIDANGGNIKPNRLGHDVFVFQIKNNKIRAMGRKDSLYPIKRYYFYCDGGSKSKDQLLGVNCAYNALFDQKYFSKL